MEDKTKQITIQDIISKKKEKSKRVDSRLLIKTYNYIKEKFENAEKEIGNKYITEMKNQYVQQCYTT